MRRIYGFLFCLMVALLVAPVLAGAAATWDVSTIVFDTAPIYTIGLAVLVLVASIVVYRKIKSILARG